MICLGDVLKTAESGFLWLWLPPAAHLQDARLAPHAMPDLVRDVALAPSSPAAGCHVKLSRLAATQGVGAHVFEGGGEWWRSD